ncbi:MAG: hypothetical protein LBD52_02645 [Prevotellaceae bacterium]|nr:hypothetical protein [Prevotellaceae bacterium]
MARKNKPPAIVGGRVCGGGKQNPGRDFSSIAGCGKMPRACRQVCVQITQMSHPSGMPLMWRRRRFYRSCNPTGSPNRGGKKKITG